MPEFTIEFSVYCSCGKGLGRETSVDKRAPAITIDPCEDCLEKAREEGRDQGREEAQKEGAG